MWDPITTDSCDVCQCTSRLKKAESSYLDKENIQEVLSPVKSEELSFYESASPSVPVCVGTSPVHCNHNLRRRPLEDHDPNSRDSGYVTNYNDHEKFLSYASPTRGSSFESASIGSMEDTCFEDFSDLEPLEENLPQGFNKLINGPIASQTKPKEKVISPRDAVLRPLFRRALSFQNSPSTPYNSRVKSCLFKITTGNARPCKRQEHSFDISPNNTKRAKFEDNKENEEEIPAVPSVPIRPLLRRDFHSTEETIKFAVHKSSTEPDLIGDFSKNFFLPLTQGRHQDLKSITPATLARLINGDFDNNVASYKVIDCRYPYEFEGGHIGGALNVYTKEQCIDLLRNFSGAGEDPLKRNILVFHCEFSSERGPNLYRYLRKQDRQLNQDAYPSLHYPEMYLLEGGYKNFFEQYSMLCVPIAYKEMLHPGHENDLRYFRSKSKTWNVDTRPGQSRSNLKKFGL